MNAAHQLDCSTILISRISKVSLSLNFLTFCIPILVFQKEWCEGPMKQLLEDEIKRNDSQAVKLCFGAMFQLLMDSRTRTKSGSQTRGTELGPFRKKFAKVIMRKIYWEKVFKAC